MALHLKEKLAVATLAAASLFGGGDKSGTSR